MRRNQHTHQHIANMYKLYMKNESINRNMFIMDWHPISMAKIT